MSTTPVGPSHASIVPHSPDTTQALQSVLSTIQALPYTREKLSQPLHREVRIQDDPLIKRLPKEIFLLNKNLTKVMVVDCPQFRKLPSSALQSPNITYIDVRGTQITSPPPEMQDHVYFISSTSILRSCIHFPANALIGLFEELCDFCSFDGSTELFVKRLISEPPQPFQEKVKNWVIDNCFTVNALVYLYMAYDGCSKETVMTTLIQNYLLIIGSCIVYQKTIPFTEDFETKVLDFCHNKIDVELIDQVYRFLIMPIAGASSLFLSFLKPVERFCRYTYFTVKCYTAAFTSFGKYVPYERNPKAS